MTSEFPSGDDLGATRAPRLTAWRLGVLAAMVYFALGSVRYLFYSTSVDLTIFYQALVTPAGPPWFEVWVKGAGRNIFGDHFHPVILVMWPLVQLVPSPLTLIAGQSMAIAAGMGLLVSGYRRRNPDDWLLFALACFANPGVLGAVMFDFHEVALGVPLLAWWVLTHVRGHHLVGVIPALAMLLVKEDMAVLVLGLGLAVLMRRAWVPAAMILASATVWAWLVSQQIIPGLAGTQYTYGDAVPKDPMTLVGNIVRAFVFPGLESITFVLLGACFLVARMDRVLLLAVVPYALLLALTGNFRYQTFFYHYYLLPSVLIAGSVLAAAHATTDRPPIGQGRRQVIAGVVGLTLVCGPVPAALWRVPWASHAQASAALAEIPSGAHVATDPALTARLAPVSKVSVLKPPLFVDGRGLAMDYVTWVVLDRATRSYGGGWVEPMIAVLRAEGFEVHSQHGRYLVLRRQGK